MKRLITLSILLALAPTAFAGVTCTFDFDNAGWLSTDPAIETYMEGIYGSDITVENAYISAILGPLGNYNGDLDIQNANVWNEDWFKISFNEEQICGMSTDWGTRANEIYIEADGQVVYHNGLDRIGVWKSGNTGWITFDNPVTTLYIHDHNLGEVAFDNLCVEKCSAIVPHAVVPAPAAIVLAMIALPFIRKIRKF